MIEKSLVVIPVANCGTPLCKGFDRNTQWIALVTTDLELSIEQIIEYYGARWKTEARFKEIRQEIGSANSQIRGRTSIHCRHHCKAGF